MLIGIAVIGRAYMDYRICLAGHRRQSPRQLYQFNY